MKPNSSPLTGAAIHAASHSIKPEWLRVPDAVRAFGISRSSLYELRIGRNQKHRTEQAGAVRGIRVISFDSLADYCKRAAAAEQHAIRVAKQERLLAATDAPK